MPSLFTRIIDGELPGHFVWRDEHCVAFLSIAPLRPGHLLVVPRAEVDHWIDLDDELAAHLMVVSRTLGVALQTAFEPVKVGLTILGLEVRHVHLHLVPMRSEADMNFANADANARSEDLAAAAETIRATLREAGASGVSE